MGINLEELYNCPDCGENTVGTDLPTFEQEGRIYYICPRCGCVQEQEEVERQLGYEEE